MCLNYIRAEQMLKAVSLYIAVNEINLKWLILIVNVLMLSAVPTPTQLECCFFCCVTKSTLTSEERTAVEL